MSDLVNDPLFYQMIGQQIALNRENGEAADEAVSLNGRINKLNGEVDKGNGFNRVLRDQVDSLSEIDTSFHISIAGVRGVTREILTELRRADPTNPLLDKKVRDSIFDGVKQAQVVRQKGTSWHDRNTKTQEYRDAAYGAEGSNKGGPEKSKITPNKAIRKAAGVPEDHIPDRERFIALIGRLANELKAHDPDASILTEKAMVDVFETYENKSQ